MCSNRSWTPGPPIEEPSHPHPRQQADSELEAARPVDTGQERIRCPPGPQLRGAVPRRSLSLPADIHHAAASTAQCWWRDVSHRYLTLPTASSRRWSIIEATGIGQAPGFRSWGPGTSQARGTCPFDSVLEDRPPSPRAARQRPRGGGLGAAQVRRRTTAQGRRPAAGRGVGRPGSSITCRRRHRRCSRCVA